MTPTVSVIVPSFQGATRLPELLTALSAQDYGAQWEVVLVIDGSSDDSAAVAVRFKQSLNLTVLDRGFNAGRSTTLNEGFADASGDILIRCDDDVLPDQNYVANFVRGFQDDHAVGVIGLYRNTYTETPYARVYGRDVDQRFRREAYATPAWKRWMYWAGNCAVHCDMWEEVGPYDADTFRAYGWEDVDWGYRLQLAGGQIQLDPQLETVHHVAATTSQVRADRA